MLEQNQKLEEIKNRCKTSSTVINVLRILTIVGIVGSLVGAVITIAFRDSVNQTMAQGFTSGEVTIDNFKMEGGLLSVAIDYDEMIRRGNYATPIIINCLIAVAITAACAYLLTLLKKVFDNLIIDDNPFSDSNMKYIKTCFIVMSVILLVFAGIGPGVICGLLCWCIYSILEYGRVLQVEVDETL